MPQFHNRFGIKGDHDSLSFESLWNIHMLDDQTVILEPGNNRLVWNGSRYTINLGMQRILWGTADGINPTDRLNPARSDLLIFGEEKKPVMAAVLDYYLQNNLSVQLVAIPWVDRNNSETALLLRESLARMGLNPQVETSQEEYQLTDIEGGLKLNGYTNAVDFSFSFLSIMDSLYWPEFELENSSGAYLPQSISLEQNRIYQLGGDLRTSISNSAFWLETGFSFQEDSFQFKADTKKPELQWISGLDYNFGTDKRHYGSIQFFGRHILGFDKSFDEDYPLGTFDPGCVNDSDYMDDYYYRLLGASLANQNEAHLLGIILNLEWADERSIMLTKLQGLYQIPLNYRDSSEYKQRWGDFILNPHIIWNLQDSLSLETGVRIYGRLLEKDDELILGEFSEFGITHNNSFYVQLKYSWYRGL